MSGSQDEWSTPYDRALQNTAFVKTMMRAPPCVGAFQKFPMETKSISFNSLLYTNICAFQDIQISAMQGSLYLSCIRIH